ncbi:MAG: transposase [Candidatus Peribacteraceae bacterium]|nr:transposase [Candidatus Peribacteraceae bacterium]
MFLHTPIHVHIYSCIHPSVGIFLPYLVRKSLAVRIHRCPYCGLIMDRDLNAAENIIQRGRDGPSSVNVAHQSVRGLGSLRLSRR